MDEKTKNSCPSCCQLYSFNTLATEPRINIPLFLKCGHTMCECCIRNFVKAAEHIECKICLRQMEIRSTNVVELLQNKTQLYKMFPVNLSALGELALDLIMEKPEIKKKKPQDHYIDLKSILSADQIHGQCLECHSGTTKMCQQCATVICEICFNESHKSFVVFKNHVLQNIEQKITPNYCKIHNQKSLEYYCKDCTKSICMDCLMVGSEKSCKSHDLVSTVEMNEKFLSDLHEIYPQVDITFRRMTKTAVDIGHLLKKMDNNYQSPELLEVVATIDQHFCKLYAMVQEHKDEVLNNVARLQSIERESLLKARENVASAIKESYKVMTAVKLALDSEKNQSTNLAALLEEAKKIINKPWSLSKIESNKDPIKVCVSEDICLLVSDYVQLVGNAQARYALCAAQEPVSPPPSAPVFPPETNGTDSSLHMATSPSKSLPRRDTVESAASSPPNEDRPNPEIKKPANLAVVTCAEKKASIELKAGVQEPALITNMRSPHDFSVRRARDEQLLSLVENQLQKSLGGVPRDVIVGMTYAVNHEHSWKRARVDAANDLASTYSYFVTFVDYGYELNVPRDELREIPAELAGPEESQYPGPLALRCRLANCEPKDGAWAPGDVDLVRKMVDRSQVLLHVRRSGVVNECDVTTRGGVSVAHALCFHSRAVLVDVLLPYPEARSAAEPRLQPANATRLRSKSRGSVLVMHVVTPGKFYVRESSLQTEYLKLCEDLNKAYESDDGSGYIYLPKSGLVCVVQVGPEQQCDFSGWARAIVTSATASEACGVWLPDCGRQLLVPWHRLRVIQPRFTVLKALAIKSHLFGVTPTGGRWHDGASRLLSRRRQELVALVQDDRPSLGLTLLDVNTAGQPVCINQEIIDSGFAEGTGPDFQSLTSEYSAKNGPTPQPVISENGAMNESKETTVSKVDQVDLPTEGKGSIKLEAKILCYESPSLFYIALLHQQKQFYDLFEDIQKFYLKRKTPRREKWKVNDRTCAFCTHSQTWRRATITNIEKDKVTVFYTDFAQTETVPISDLKKLHSDFEMIGNAAIKCHLARVLPASGEWPSLTKEFLKDKLDEYKRLFITGVGQFVDMSMPVELWVYHTERGSALEPDQSEWRCLNNELVARGLAVHPNTTPQNGIANGWSDDDTVSFLNVQGPVQSWLLPLPPLPSSGSGSSSDVRQSDPFVTHWLLPEPLRAEEFTAVPTYIDNEAIIYLHDVAQQDDLEFIRDTLEMAFKEPDPKAQFCTWRVGEPCVARYYLDGQFYRGIIEEVHVEQSNCLVQYVDYGNSEICTFEDLRKRIALHQIPIQAHKCCLSRIKPSTERWSQDVLDYVHKAIVEKKCFVRVTGPAVDGVTPIDLKYDKLWFNDHLVEFDLAVYIDGSKPLTRQFAPKKTPKNKRNVDRTTNEVAENTIIKVDCSSEPDYIVEEDIESSQASGSPDSFKMRTLVDQDTGASEAVEIADAELTEYPRHEGREFSCNIPVINETDCLELSILRDPEFNLIYEELFETVKEEGGKMPLLKGIFEYKPCIALFEGSWYRASILKYSETKNLIKVHYVDYGNIGIVPLSDAREISKDWVRIPPVCMTVRLHRVQLNPNLHPDEITEAYINTFLDKGPFNAKIIDYDNPLPVVELRNSRGELVYQKLIDDNVFLYEACDN